ncbi:glycosyltransferase [Candidatus Omnitrophota bacterium]
MDTNKSTKPTILLLSTTLDQGGCEKMVYELVRGIDKDMFRVIVAALIGEGPYGKKIKAEGVDVHYLKMKGYLDVTVFKRLEYLIRDYNITLIHSFLFHANIIGRLAAHFNKVPHNISAVRTMERGAHWHLIFDILTKAFVEFELTNSELVRLFMVKKTFSNPEKIRTIHNGIFCNEIPLVEEQAKLKRELGIEEGQLVVGTVGCLEVAKGHDMFLKIAKCIVRKRDDITFVIVGEGRLRKKLERKIKLMRLKKKVILAGFREDAVKVMSFFNVFILTSRWEGFPNVILEAMSQKVPVISTDVGGVCEIITPGENGELVTGNNVNTFVSRIGTYLSDTVLREKYSHEGYRSVIERYPLSKMIDQTMMIYKLLLDVKE